MLRTHRANRWTAIFLGITLTAAEILSACSATDEAFSSSSAGTTGSGGTGGDTTAPASSSGSGMPATDDDGDGFSEDDGDCDDNDKDVHPDAIEICDDNIDNNCNGAVDNAEPDADGDGFGPCAGDCNDNDPNVSPSAPEIDGDGIDNNCDGIIDADFDGDGYTVMDGDCDDGDKDVHPGAKEDCFDGVDNNCNGFVDDQEPDADMDGFGPCAGDCNDNDPNINPNAPEIDGDGIDNNCDNLVDADIDGDGWTVQNGDCNDLDPNINPAALEKCGDMIDNDCDNVIDTDCLTACELAEATRSSVGCTYFAVDQENYSSYNFLQYSVVVSNVSATDSASVQAQVYQNGAWNTLETAIVGPITLHQFDLPDRHTDNSNLSLRGAYRIVSDYPVIAYQFNPVDGQSSYTSDASLLLPTSALDTHYVMVGYPQTPNGTAHMVITASQDNTTVKITPTVATAAGGPVPALQPGVQTTLPMLLNEGDFVQIVTTKTGDSLNGTEIDTDKPVAVFTGHKCVNIPANQYACDHLEEQMTGLQTWGKTYVASRMPVRSLNFVEATIWHVVASEANTTVSFLAHPSVTGLPVGPQVMNKGQALELTVSGSATDPGDFIVKADKPVHVMAYLTCASNVVGVPNAQKGDPAMTQIVPSEQFRSDYLVLVPLNWVNDYFIITKRVGQTVSVDGILVPQAQFQPINDSINPVEWEVARISVSDGVHTMNGSQPFGIVVVGYDSYDSYAYPGGLNQTIINPIN